ncbi:hypothetical protein DFH11DRAFT_1691370 [Phellopilus nigrolimitatus]|nr:hypothetical protein DFH11DRAFT_1691370 [Phellopilus nigrolimitatus]
MSDGQDKAASPATAEQQQHQGQPVYAIQQPGPYAGVGSYPPYYPYPMPPTDANGHPADPNGAPGAYMMAFPPPPPGMIYAYPTAQGYPGMPFTPGMPLPAALVRPKRKQVKMACTNCASACKRCDEGRPCERCCKYGISDTCQDGVRKERKKGIKRGPYKRKGKINADAGYESFPPEQSPQEAFYHPYFYPSGGLVTVGPDGQPGMPHPQYYPLHPAPYPPYAFPHGGTGTYPVMGGHMLGPPGSSGEPGVAGQGAPPMTAGSSDADDSALDGDAHASVRGRKRKTGTSLTAGSGATAGTGGRDDQGSSKKTGKRAAVPSVDDGGGGASTGLAGAQDSPM